MCASNRAGGRPGEAASEKSECYPSPKKADRLPHIVSGPTPIVEPYQGDRIPGDYAQSIAKTLNSKRDIASQHASEHPTL